MLRLHCDIELDSKVFGGNGPHDFLDLAVQGPPRQTKKVVRGKLDKEGRGAWTRERNLVPRARRNHALFTQSLEREI